MAINFWREVFSDVKATMRLATPIVLSSTITAGLAITDNYFLSRLTSPIPLAGYGLAAAFLVIFYATLYGFLNPLVVMIGQAAGKRDNKQVGEIIRVGCLMAFLGGAIFGLLLSGCYFLLGLFGQPAEVVEHVFGYWFCVSLAMIFWATGAVIKQALDALRKNWTATIIYSSMVVINLPVAYFFIFGIPGVIPPLGLTGAGIGWLVADGVTNSIFFFYLFLAPSMKKYHGNRGNKKLANKSVLYWFLKTPLDKKIIKQFFTLSIPVTIESFFEVCAYAMIGIMIGWFGVSELAGRQISNGFLEMLYMIPVSMTYATTIVVANMVGKRQFSKLRIAGLASLLTVLTFTVVSTIFLLLFAEKIALAFGNDLSSADYIIPLATGFLIIGAASQIIDGVQSVMLGALRGMGDFTFSSFVSVVGYLVIGLPLAYFLGFHVFHHPFAVYIGLIIGVLCAAIILVLRFWHKTKPV